ncbi:MAG: molybdenum cofactor biosynthesis protein MoaE [Cyanobacteriota bacterium]|nr:molybdenum cofactor biosynthesis protein MoaE [Cyanobacteriota bacterium]
MTVISVTLHNEPFNPLALLAGWEASLPGLTGELPAALASFVGRVRGRSTCGAPLAALELEHYPGMTEAQIRRCAHQAGLSHQALALRVAHRVGRAAPGEALVLVAAAADRRGPAQRACSELLETLKHEAPFWKKEWRADGTAIWLQGNTSL